MSMLAPFFSPTVRYGMGLLPGCLFRSGSIHATRGFKEKPRSTLGFIDPNFDQTRGGNVAMLVAHVVSLTKARGQLFVVVGQLSEHVQRLDVFRIVIEDALSARDLSDRMQCKSAEFTNAFRD